MRYRNILILVCLYCTSCYSQADKSLISNWNIYPVPTNADTLNKYSRSEKEWTVFVKNDTLKVVDKKNYVKPLLPFKMLPGNRDEQWIFSKAPSFLKVDDGYLVGFNRGEWGGYLYWFSQDGKRHYKISDDEVINFIKRDGKNYAIQGLAHLSLSEGSIINIEKENNKWVAKEYLKLPGAPDAIVLDSHQNFIVITSKSLLRINKDTTINTLVGKGIWWFSYTNSLVIKNDIIYAGMRAGVYKYDLLTNKEYWLLNY